MKLANELLFTLKLTSIFQSMNCQPILWFGIHFTHFLLVCIPHLVLHNLLNCKLVLCSDKWVFNHFQICMENRNKEATKEKYPLFELPPTAIHVPKQNWVLFTQISFKWHVGVSHSVAGKKEMRLLKDKWDRCWRTFTSLASSLIRWCLNLLAKCMFFNKLSNSWWVFSFSSFTIDAAAQFMHSYKINPISN